MPRFKTLINLVFGAVISFAACTASAEILTIGESLNKSGLQRMLTQNILKNYLLLGLDVNVQEARRELDRSVALFEEQFQDLVDYAPNSKVSAALDKVEPLWYQYRSFAIGDVNKMNAARLLDTNTELLKACHQVVVELEAHANRDSAQQVNISGRQRMLSQRIAAYYFAHAMGFRDQGVVNTFNTATKEYSDGLDKLAAFKKNTPEISKSLKRVKTQWQFSNMGFKQVESGNYVPHVIAVTTNGMLKKMNEITGMYENLDTNTHGGGRLASTLRAQ